MEQAEGRGRQGPGRGAEEWASLTEPGTTPRAGGSHCAEGEFDRAELRTLLEDEARRLVQNGVAPGDRVVIASENCHRAYAGFHGAIAAGATAVPLNVRVHAREMANILTDIDATAIIYHPDVREALDAGLAMAQRPTPLLLDAFESPSEGTKRSFEWRTLPDPLVIFTTSGSTGRPKGVTLTAASLLANAHQMLDIKGLETGQRYLHAAPVFHLGDASTGVAAALAGCEHVFVSKFDAKEAARTISELADFRSSRPLLPP